MSSPKIVVVTPVKNEAWILDRFLAVTSQFADHIIIADQYSTDESRNICQRYPKVVVIDNRSRDYDEAERQLLLLQAARQQVAERRIILALDADEILAADAMTSPGWRTMLNAQPGTVLCFEKPDLYITPDKCIRYETPWPIGFVDDGTEHKPKKVHSIRIPMPEYAPRLFVHDVRFLHYRLTRPEAEAAKLRMYSVLENIHRSSSTRRRRIKYAGDINHALAGTIEHTPTNWFAGWENMNIDMHTITCSRYYWYDFEVLRQFSIHGTRQFWADDIWNYDWEDCRRYLNSRTQDQILNHLDKPPRFFKAALRFLDLMDRKARDFKNKVRVKESHRGWR